jgi:hypothetical protein
VLFEQLWGFSLQLSRLPRCSVPGRAESGEVDACVDEVTSFRGSSSERKVFNLAVKILNLLIALHCYCRQSPQPLEYPRS